MGRNNKESPVAHVRDVEEQSTFCRVAKLTVKLAMLQAPAIVQAPVAGLQLVETHSHLIRRKLAMALKVHVT